MPEFYAQIKLVHIAAVLASGALFLIRGIGMQLAASWQMSAPVRYLSYGIDTVLLTAALMLSSIVRQFPFVHGWLTTKVLLLVAYVMLGSVALKRGRTRQVRVACWVAAIGIYVFIITVARTHDPLGALRGIISSAGAGAALCVYSR